MSAALSLLALMAGAIVWLLWLSRKEAAQETALLTAMVTAAQARDAEKRAKAETAAITETISRVEDATLAIHDRDSALASLRSRHPAK